jgi:hypothetical protein
MDNSFRILKRRVESRSRTWPCQSVEKGGLNFTCYHALLQCFEDQRVDSNGLTCTPPRSENILSSIELVLCSAEYDLHVHVLTCIIYCYMQMLKPLSIRKILFTIVHFFSIVRLEIILISRWLLIYYSRYIYLVRNLMISNNWNELLCIFKIKKVGIK